MSRLAPLTLALAGCTAVGGEGVPAPTTAERLSREHRLDHARQLVFQGRLDEALSWVEQLREQAPGDPVLASWRRKIQDGRADLWVAEAKLELDAFRHENARNLAAQALEASPGHAEASEIRDSIDAWLADRRASADLAYGRALHHMSDERWHEAAAQLEGALADDPGHPDAQRQLDRVRRELGHRRLDLSGELSGASLWGAARQATMMARDLAPAIEEIDRLLEVAEVEETAAEDLRAARRALAGGDLAAARESMASARAGSARQSEAVAELEAKILTAQDEMEYGRARDLERRRDVEGALALYEGLIERNGHHKDAIARADVLRGVRSEMQALYERALAAETAGQGDEARALFQGILERAPFFRDVPDRLRALD